ncbi:MAG TPA: hypothetical protein VL524_01835 [Gemmatimonadaceae bacterium]|jgi:hypothetical protein|nr:hypothetical protein [Gemmatimonadaceae bacterium]
MSVGDWLRDRAPAPPQLTARITSAVGDELDATADDATAVFLDGAERLLQVLVARPSAGRESALDLLTVDALVTYAFEAASESPESLTPRAIEALQRLAGLAIA